MRQQPDMESADTGTERVGAVGNRLYGRSLTYSTGVAHFYSVLLHLSLALMLLAVLLVPTAAQQAKDRKTGKSADKSKTEAQKTSSPVASTLPGTQQCEGALEVIPRRELTFERKRRPAKKPSAKETDKNDSAAPQKSTSQK